MSSFAKKKPWHLNGLLKEAVKSIPRAKFWLHQGLYIPLRNIFTRGGINLDNEGHQAPYRSYQGAILFALNSKELNPSCVKLHVHPSSVTIGLAFRFSALFECYLLLLKLGQNQTRFPGQS